MSDVLDFGFQVDPSGLKRGTAEMKKLVRESDRLEDNLDGTQKAFKNLGVVGKAVGITIAGAIAKGLAEIKDYGKAIGEVSTLLDSSWDPTAIDRMSDSVRDLAVEFGGNVRDNAKGLYDIISAGAGDSATSIDTLTAANKLAVGGVTDVASAADGLTTVMNAYGKSAGTASDISDTFFSAMAFGKTTVGELSANIGKTAPLAAQLGISFDETAIGAAALTKAGISTSEAFTGLNGILKAVLKPTKEALDLSEKLGIEFNTTALRTKGLAGFLNDLTEKTGGSQEQMAKLFGDIEGLRAALALTGPLADDFAKGLQLVADNGGKADEAVQKITEGAGRLAFQWDKTKSIVTEIFLDIGDAAEPAAFAILNSFNETYEQLPIGAAKIWREITAAFKIGVLTVENQLDGLATSGLVAWNRLKLGAVETASSLAKTFDWIPGVSSDFSGLEKSVRDQIKSLEDSRKTSQNLYKAQISGLKKVFDGTDDVTKATKDAAVANAELASKFDDIASTSDKALENLIKVEETEDGLTKTTKELNSALVDQQTLMDQQIGYSRDLSNAYRAIVDRLEPAAAATRTFREEQQVLWEKVEAGTITFERYVELNDLLIDEMDKAETGTGKLSQAFSTAESAISSALGNILTGAKDFGTSLVDIFKSIGNRILGIVLDDIAGGIVKAFKGIFSEDDFSFGDIFDFKNIIDGGKKVIDVFTGASSAIGLFEGATLGAGGATALLGTGISGLGAGVGSATTGLIGLQGAATGLGAGAAAAGVELGVLGSTATTAGGAFGGMGASLAAAGPWIAAAAAGALVLSKALDGGRSKSEIFRDEFAQLTQDVQTGAAELFNLAGGFQAAGSSAALFITGDDLGRLQQFIDKIPGIQTRLQEINGEPVLRVLDSMERGVVELDNIIKGETASMTESFATFSAKSQEGAKELSGTYVTASKNMLQAGENASSRIGDSFNSAADVTESAADRMDRSLSGAADSATGKIQDFSSRSVSNIGNAEGAANSLTSAINAIPSNKTVNIRFNVDRDPSGDGGGFANGTAGQFLKVPSGFPNDSFPVFMQSGEDFMVRTKAQQAAGAGESPSANPSDVKKLSRQLMDANSQIIDLLEQINANQNKQLTVMQ